MKQLPILTITDDIDGSIKKYIPMSYLLTVLRKLENIALQSDSLKIADEIYNLHREIET